MLRPAVPLGLAFLLGVSCVSFLCMSVLPGSGSPMDAAPTDAASTNARGEGDDPDVVLRLTQLEDSLVASATPELVGASKTDVPHTVAAQVARREELGHILGPDPFRILAVGAAPVRWVLLLRGCDQIALLDGDPFSPDGLRIRTRIPTPPEPSSWTTLDDRYVLVAGEGSGRIALYDTARDLAEVCELDLPAVSLRGIAFDPRSRVGFALDPIGDRALSFLVSDPDRSSNGAIVLSRLDHDLDLPAGPLQAAIAGDFLVTDCLLAHTIVVHRRSTDPDRPWIREATIEHDGPIWSFDVGLLGDTLWVAAGGIEDHPLDRTEGEFGYVDSYLYLYRSVVTDGHAGSFQRIEQWNLSELGVVTPKRVKLEPDRIRVAGFGGEWLASVPWAPDAQEKAGTSGRSAPVTFRVPPGISDFVVDPSGNRLVAVSPLLDALIEIPLSQGADAHADPTTIEGSRGRLAAMRTIPAANASSGDTTTSGDATTSPDAPTPTGPTPIEPATDIADATRRRADLRLGELLVFTTLLTPDNQTDGELSRFTCEACHFEGGIDGRTHYTGRENVFATTKPIRGLGNNVPLFSRSGASSLAEMVPAEFRVANQHRMAAHEIPVSEHPWLCELAPGSSVDSFRQRRAMLQYLFELPPIPQPDRTREWTEDETRGLQVFRDRCARCHLPVLSTRAEEDRVPVEDWTAWLSQPRADLVWAAPFLIKTGVEPYVSEAGARVPSLRRVLWKRPYFTNGTANSLDAVLEDFRHDRAMGWHDPRGVPRDRPDVKALTADERRELGALLRRF
ncbi:MAG: hypothetical protein R3E12_11910 [Candidatus Eisenbacteria bacterium]|uniref:Cytochrome c domain-containing protein n=1 Tax=Eiseniibacteriota bacterium TaxID=2212470 RepID=A0A956LW10_UNCEI|nr:hypothetical protein [Candidatus Eisenbacteria bacterium]